MFNIISEELKNKFDSMAWFHAIKFGDYSTKGRFDKSLPPNWTLFGVYHYIKDIDVTDCNCLDIGTMDGITAFTLKQRGASKVTATDIMDRQGFRAAREALGLSIDYLPDADIKQIENIFPPHSFDLIVMSGVIYHILSPLFAIASCRNLLKKDGLLILETAYTTGDEPVLKLNTELEKPMSPEVYTYWVPTRKGIEGMLRFASFEVLSRADTGLGRISYLAKAVKPSEISNRTNQLRSMHEQVKFCENLNFKVLEEADHPLSSIKYNSGKGEENVEINIYKYNTDFISLQPQFKPPKQAIWSTLKKKYL